MKLFKRKSNFVVGDFVTIKASVKPGVHYGIANIALTEFGHRVIQDGGIIVESMGKGYYLVETGNVGNIVYFSCLKHVNPKPKFGLRKKFNDNRDWISLTAILMSAFVLGAGFSINKIRPDSYALGITGAICVVLNIFAWHIGKE